MKKEIYENFKKTFLKHLRLRTTLGKLLVKLYLYFPNKTGPD